MFHHPRASSVVAALRLLIRGNIQVRIQASYQWKGRIIQSVHIIVQLTYELVDDVGKLRRSRGKENRGDAVND